jgi:hypothetical protein
MAHLHENVLRNGELNPGLPGASLDHCWSLKTGYVCHYTISEVIDEESLDYVNIYLKILIECGLPCTILGSPAMLWLRRSRNHSAGSIIQ